MELLEVENKLEKNQSLKEIVAEAIKNGRHLHGNAEVRI